MTISINSIKSYSYVATACVAAVACYYSAYRPVLRFHAAMAQAYEVTSPAERAVAFMDAAVADPLASEPWLAIAELDLEMLKKEAKRRNRRLARQDGYPVSH